MTSAYCQFCLQPIAGTVLRHHGANACPRCYSTQVGPLPAGVALDPPPRVGVPPHGPARLPTRQEVRRLTTDHAAARRRAIAEGRNPHQVALDQQDQVQAYAALLSPDEAVVFLTLYAEEMEALVAEIEQQTRTMLAEHAEREARSWAAGQGLAGVILFVFFLVMMRGCS